MNNGYEQGVLVQQNATATPQREQIALGYRKHENGETISHDAILADDTAGDLFAVLKAFRSLLVVAGFDYIVSVSVETEDGHVFFSDDV
jgi:hypothetical protein